MKRHTLPLLSILALAILSSLWLAGCARQEAPSAAKAPTVSAAQRDRTAETAAIRQSLHRYVEENGWAGAPEADVYLAQVSIASDYALVTWTHEGKGGQALLQKRTGAWKVAKCGPGWMGLQGLGEENVPAETAKKLLDEIDSNWPSYETL